MDLSLQDILCFKAAFSNYLVHELLLYTILKQLRIA